MGLFIAIEGLDGSGKTTQSKLLADYLDGVGKKVRYLSFPDYESEGAALVRLYLNGGLGENPNETNAYASTMFFAADRYISMRRGGWKDDINEPDTFVIANRYTTANAYHQLAKLPREEWDCFLDWLWDFEFIKLGLPVPDKVIFLSMPRAVSEKLVEKRCRETGVIKDIHEADSTYLDYCYTAARYAAEKWGWKIVECADNSDIFSKEVIFNRLIEALDLKY